MFHLLTIAIVGWISISAHAELECQASESLINSKSVQTTSVPLAVVMNNKIAVALHADLGSRSYSLSADPVLKEYKLMITQGPDWDKGVITSGTYLTSTSFAVTEVNKELVYRLECKDKPPEQEPPSEQAN